MLKAPLSKRPHGTVNVTGLNQGMAVTFNFKRELDNDYCTIPEHCYKVKAFEKIGSCRLTNL